MFDPEIITTINPKKDYTITEIVANGLIVNMEGVPTRAYVQKLIIGEVLPAKNVCANKKYKLYLIKGQWIIDYLKKRYL